MDLNWVNSRDLGLLLHDPGTFAWAGAKDCETFVVLVDLLWLHHTHAQKLFVESVAQLLTTA